MGVGHEVINDRRIKIVVVFAIGEINLSVVGLFHDLVSSLLFYICIISISLSALFALLLAEQRMGSFNFAPIAISLILIKIGFTFKQPICDVYLSIFYVVEREKLF